MVLAAVAIGVVVGGVGDGDAVTRVAVATLDAFGVGVLGTGADPPNARKPNVRPTSSRSARQTAAASMP